VRVGSLPKATALDAPPLWPPLLATRGPGALSAGHAHHAMHLLLAADGELRVRSDGETRWRRGAGVLTAPDVKHEIDGRGVDVLLVFIDPESDVGEAFLPLLSERPIRVVDAKARDALVAGADPMTIMRAGGVEWTRRAVDVLGGTMPRARRPLSPDALRRGEGAELRRTLLYSGTVIYASWPSIRAGSLPAGRKPGRQNAAGMSTATMPPSRANTPFFDVSGSPSSSFSAFFFARCCRWSRRAPSRPRAAPSLRDGRRCRSRRSCARDSCRARRRASSPSARGRCRRRCLRRRLPAGATPALRRSMRRVGGNQGPQSDRK
jgi:hypothetical protein